MTMRMLCRRVIAIMVLARRVNYRQSYLPASVPASDDDDDDDDMMMMTIKELMNMSFQFSLLLMVDVKLTNHSILVAIAAAPFLRNRN